MTAPIKFPAAALLATLVACSGTGGSAPVDEALERDLKLAASSIALAPATANLANLETAPAAAEEPAPRPRAARSGSRIVRSASPTVRAAATDEMASGDAEGSSAEVVQPVALEADPGEASADAGVALPRPVPASVGVGAASEGNGSGDYGSGERGTGNGGGGGGIWGVVMRGGGVGGIDDCEIHDRRGRGRRPVSTNGGGIWRQPASRPSSGGRGGVWGADTPQRTAEAPRGGGSRGGVWGGVRRN